MTNVIVNAIDVLGQEIDEGVVKISAADIQYTGGTLMLPEYHEQELVSGSTTITGVTPGKVVISIHWGVNRTATFRVFVPDTTEITLAELALQKYDTDPAVVSQVADAALRAEDAAAQAEGVADAFGSLEGIQAAVDGAASSAAAAAGSATAAADSAAGAAASENAAAGSAGSAAGDAASAAASEGVASTAATNAASSETAAADHSSDAQDAATAAASSATAAAGSATAAAGSATDAAGSATAAAGSATDAGDAAVRAETAAESAEVGIAPDSVLRTMLEPSIRLELDGLRTDVDGVSSSWSDITDKPTTFPPESHTHPSTGISDATTVGRSVLAASSQAAARQAIGAGTSSLALGTTSATAAAGNHTHSQYATTTALESRTPEIRVVSTIPTSPTPGVVYLRFG